MIPFGFISLPSSSPGGYDTDAVVGFAAAGISDVGQKDAINTFIVGVKSYGLWASKLKAIYLMVGGSEAAHSVNWRAPGTYDLTFHGGATHSSTGVAWNGTTGYASTGLVPSAVLPQDSEHYSYYSRSSSTANGYDVGSAHLTGQYQWSGLGIYANQFNAFINNANSSTATVTANISDGSGFWVGSRTSSNNLEAYHNGSSIGSNADNNIWVHSNNEITLGATNIGSIIQFSGREMAFATIGEGLTSTDVSNLSTLVQALQTSLGRQV